MKKPQISLDSAKMKAFLLNHVEKIVLVGFVGVMLLIIWQGFSLKGLDANKKPSGLIGQSNQAMQFIDTPTRWEEVLKKERVPVMDVSSRTAVALLPSDPAAYALSMQLNKP